jgi:hypothetical protein
MNWNWYALRRLRGALILILLGVVFLLNESSWFHFDVWPLFLIGLGVILLAERLIPLPPPPPPTTGYQQYPYGYTQPGQPYPYGTQPPSQAAPAVENPSTQDPRTGEWR